MQPYPDDLSMLFEGAADQEVQIILVLLLMDSTSALGIGAVAAGCNFICSYLMLPGTLDEAISAMQHAFATAQHYQIPVVVESGDGDMYGEGGNHFLHAIRRNDDVTIIVYNNIIYDLTKGQASLTSQHCMKTLVQTGGVLLEPFNPLAVAISLDAPFVARAFTSNVEETQSIIMETIRFKGCSIVDVFQPCVIFNKLNIWQWFRENAVELPEDHDPSNCMAVLEMAFRNDKFPLGVFYRNDGR